PARGPTGSGGHPPPRVAKACHAHPRFMDGRERDLDPRLATREVIGQHAWVASAPTLLIKLAGLARASAAAQGRRKAQDRALRLRSSRSFHIRNWGPRLAMLGAPICPKARPPSF